jgi:hypothetical protein
MKLNIKKCKELGVSFLGETPQLMPLTIDGHPVETVRSHKVLGLTIQNNPKWDEHIPFSYPEPFLRAVNRARRGALAKSISNWLLIGHNEIYGLL